MKMTERKVSGTILDAKTAAEQTLAAQREIEEISGSLHNFQFEKMTVEKDGKLIEIEVPIDDIDLLDDFDDDDLTEEGERSLGMIDAEYDSTSNVQKETKSRTRLTQGELRLDENGDMEIICPFTGSNKVYQISSNVFASYETDQPFRVDFNLADTKIDEED
jgi:hypothetical protein